MRILLIIVLVVIAINTCSDGSEYWSRIQQAADVVLTGEGNE